MDLPPSSSEQRNVQLVAGVRDGHPTTNFHERTSFFGPPKVGQALLNQDDSDPRLVLRRSKQGLTRDRELIDGIGSGRPNGLDQF